MRSKKPNRGRNISFNDKKRLWRQFAAGVLIILALVAVRYAPARRSDEKGIPDTIAGRARVIDGDSLRVGGKEVRLQGIDAPEGRQKCRRFGKDWPCGERSADKLKSLTGRAKLICKVSKRDRFRRFLATCYAGRKNLNREMVVQGWAVSYGRYKGEEARARKGGRGIWVGEFERPRAWRDKHHRRN